ncbi:uncharacterized protein IL334_003941 [Kwoniella shivajii]|uniref:Fork-head domain-containing protein n=1 Tax=Kwoniella shivajii TaxID=564305 RepID=A0ABZ1CZD0_9TREE|nr:hypothetical protein IL334_003941 [Kwoniella shivajii]
MYPTRKAPNPPASYSMEIDNKLPPNHPFATYYIPPSHHQTLRSSKTDRTISRPMRYDQRQSTHPSYSRSSSTSPSTPNRINPYAPLPTELSLFDPKSRQTLLSDVEYILGKKLHFPFINSFTKDRKKKEKKMSKLIKGKEEKEGWVWLPENNVVIIDKQRGRGVREGNYI